MPKQNGPEKNHSNMINEYTVYTNALGRLSSCIVEAYSTLASQAELQWSKRNGWIRANINESSEQLSPCFQTRDLQLANWHETASFSTFLGWCSWEAHNYVPNSMYMAIRKKTIFKKLLMTKEWCTQHILEDCNTSTYLTSL